MKLKCNECDAVVVITPQGQTLKCDRCGRMHDYKELPDAPNEAVTGANRNRSLAERAE